MQESCGWCGISYITSESTLRTDAASKFRVRDRTQPPAEDLDAVAVVTVQGREFGSRQIANEEGKEKRGLLKQG